MSQDRLKIQYLQGAYSIKQQSWEGTKTCSNLQRHYLVGKGIMKAVASDLLGPLKI